MAKVSRPIVYAVVAAVGIYAVVLLTEPEPMAKQSRRTAAGAASPKAPAGFAPEDMTARFDRLASGPARDAFRPGIIPERSQQAIAAVSKPAPLPSGLSSMLPPLAGKGTWALTGVSETDGRRSALIENPTTGDNEFLEVGQSWNGLTVAEIDEDSIVFVNALGQRTRLMFTEPPEEGARPAGAPAAAPGAQPPGAPAAPGRNVPGPIAKVVPRSATNGVVVAPGGVAPVVPQFPTRVGSNAPARPRPAAEPAE